MIGYPFNSHLEYDEHDIPVYDRAISSGPLKNLIAKLFSNGVLPNPSTNLQVVTGGEGMSVIVKAGFCIINGGLKLEDEDKTLVVQASDAIHPRIDTVVMRWNDNDEVRACDLYVIEGTPAATPIRPALTRTESVYEIGLADIYITARSTSIDSFRITDTRMDNARCGYISSISEFDTTTLYNQIQSDLDNFQENEQADFLAWFEEMRDQLSEDAAGNLQLQIDNVNGRYDGLTEDINAFRVVNQLPEVGAAGTLYLVTGEEETHFAGNVDDNKKIINDNVITTDSAFSSLHTSDLLENKVDKEDGKGLSKNDFTDAHKTKLDGLPSSFKTINGFSITGEGNISITGSDVSEYPDYASTEMEMVAAKIKSYIDTINNPIIIGFDTDQHIPKMPSQGDSATRNEITYGLKTLRDLTKRFPFNLVVLGGDTHGTSTGLISMMQESAIYVTNQLDGCNCPLMALVGNHEGGQDNTNITRAQVYKSHVTPSMQNKTIIKVDGTNGYYDDDSCNVRFVFVESLARSEVNYLTTDINRILASMLSTIPTGYKAIIFSHHPLDENLPQVAGRKGWNNPTACHDTLQAYKDKIIACFDGHVHNNLNIDQDGITFVATTCAGIYELNDGSTRTAGTADFTAYDVFVIDTDAKMIHAIRYGNGADRDISYAHADQPRGNILNDVAWTDGKRLNSSGALVDASGYSTTDIIADVNAGDVLYFADGCLSINKNTWDLYDDEGNSVGKMWGISADEYGCDYNVANTYAACLNASNGVVQSTLWGNCISAKGTQTGNNRFTFGEFTFWNSGFVKSCKVAYDGVHQQTIAKIRFTFPTAKKADLDIRVNEPFPAEVFPLDGNIMTGVTWYRGTRLQSDGSKSETGSYSTTSRVFGVKNGDILYFADGTYPFSKSAINIYNDSGEIVAISTPISDEDYGATWATDHMYIGLYDEHGANLRCTYMTAINAGKKPDATYPANGFMLSEIEYWESGYVKSAKIGDSEHYLNVDKIAFTFPTAKIGHLDIRVNNPFE